MNILNFLLANDISMVHFNRAGVWEEAWEKKEAACLGTSGANKEKETKDGNLRCGRMEGHFWRRALESAINSK